MPMWSWFAAAPASNATADPAIGWAEGQAPSTINDSARAMMAVIKQRDNDITGLIVTGGTSTAYTMSSFSGYTNSTALAHQSIAFTPHTTNGATVTLNVDGVGAKPLRTSPGVELAAGTIIQGTPYTATYNDTDGAFYLHGFYGPSPNLVPLFTGMDFWDTISPNSSFAFATGQALSRTTYAAAFARWGTTYGAGDGTTTFNMPNKMERVSVMKTASPSLLTSSYFGGNSSVMGATGGGESETLTTPNLPSYTPVGSVTGNTSTGTSLLQTTTGSVGSAVAGGSIGGISPSGSTTLGTVGITASFVGSAQGGTSTPFRTVQPTIVCNYIIRVI